MYSKLDMKIVLALVPFVSKYKYLEMGWSTKTTDIPISYFTQLLPIFVK